MLTRILRPIARVARRGTRQYHKDDKPFQYANMNELPVPQGSWREYYDKKQKLYHAQLAAAIAFFGIAVAIANANGVFYLNLRPKLPEGYVIKKYYD